VNWFKQHLNWTFFIAWLIGITLYLVSIPLIISSEGPELFILSYSIFIVWLLLVGWWFLRQKSRSLWYLLMLPFLREIGVIIFLSLETRITPQGSEVFRLSDIYKSSDTDKLIRTNYDFQYLQEVLSCPTCIYADQEARNKGNPWCVASQPPDIRNNHCNTWQPVNKQ